MEVHDSSLSHLALRRIRAMIIEEQQSISSADEQRVRDIGLVIGLVEPGSETLVSQKSKNSYSSYTLMPI